MVYLWSAFFHIKNFFSSCLYSSTYTAICHPRPGKAKSLQKELSAANSQIERYIQEEERHRIARDLHDTLGQTLTMIKLKSELTIRLIEKDTTQAKQELNDILDTSRFALKQVRELVTDMKYISIESELNHLRELLRTAGINSQFMQPETHLC